MREILLEWRKYMLLLEAAVPENLQSLIVQINNGSTTISQEQIKLLTNYVDQTAKQDPNAAGYVAGVLYVFYRNRNSKSPNSGDALLMRAYQKISNDLRGIPTGKNVAQIIAGISDSIYKSTGIRMLDPTGAKVVPKWGVQNPGLYAAAQTTADLFAEDPVSIFMNFIPFGKAGKAANFFKSTAANVAQNAEKKLVATGLKKATTAATTGGEKRAVTALSEKTTQIYKQEAKNAATELMQKLPANVKKDAAPAVALKTALDNGVLNADTLFDYLRKTNPQITRQEVVEIMNKFLSYKNTTNVLSPTEAIMEFQRLRGTYSELVRKYGIGVDLDHLTGAYVTKAGAGQPEWMRYVYELAESSGNKEIMAATEINLGRAVGFAEKKGSALFRRLFHEIGHVEFLKNYKEVARTFYTEWAALARRQVYARQKELLNMINSRFRTQYKFEDLFRREVYTYIMENLPKAEAEIFRNKFGMVNQIKRLTDNFINVFEQNIDKPDGLKKIFSEMDNMYNMAQDEIRTLLPKKAGRDVGNIYFLIQPEETFAELFEKTARAVIGGQTEVASKNFPETIKLMQKYATQAARGSGMIKESLFKRKKKKVLYIF